MNIAKEIFTPLSLNKLEYDEEIFFRVMMDHESNLDQLRDMTHQNIVPVLLKAASDVHPSRWDQAYFSSLINEHVDYANRLKLLGFSRIALAADLDGSLQNILSPRFSTLDLSQRMAPLLAIYGGLALFIFQVEVVLTVEELAPSGLDAYDGIAIAQALNNLGLTHIIATSGTRDFPLLYDRRMTKKKTDELDDFDSGEPALACGLWLTSHTDLDVSVLTTINNRNNAINLAHDIGLIGLIEKSVYIELIITNNTAVNINF